MSSRKGLREHDLDSAGASPGWGVPSGDLPEGYHTARRGRTVSRSANPDPSTASARGTGLDRFPSRSFAINQAWLAVVMLAVDLIAWTQHLLLSGELAKAEPKTMRYRLLHVAARLTSGQRRLWLASNAAGRGPTTSPRCSPGSRRCPFPLVDRRSRHDERRSYRQNQHGGQGLGKVAEVIMRSWSGRAALRA
jgi:hypothetical protein